MSKATTPPVIRLRGVRHNNLKNFDLDLPLHRLIVVTGLSGSGKSTLAFDTLFAEGQRRYIETFSPYARQFFDRMDKPQVDSIEGIPPAIAIEQRNAVKTTRSTVGTMTEICDYMKLLWPQIAQLHCRQCGQPVRKDTPQSVWRQINDECRRTNGEVLITFDLALSEKLSLDESLALVAKQGYTRLLVNDEIVRIDNTLTRSSPLTPHSSLTVIQDRLRPVSENRARFVEACEHAYHFGKGKLAIREIEPPASASPFVIRHSSFFSNRLHCAACDLDYREPSPALFSFNHPLGACPACRGFGRIITIDYRLAIPDRGKTLVDGAIKPWQTGHGLESQADLLKFCKARGVPTKVPFADLSPEHQRWIVEGDPDYGVDEEHEWPRAWYGVKGYFRWLESKAYKMHVRVLLSRYRAYTPCPDCRGARFQPESLLYFLSTGALSKPRSSPARKLTLADFYRLPIRDAFTLVDELHKTRVANAADRNSPLALVLSEVRSRLGYLNEVGLGYLTLDRPTRSLSGGETERVNLTTCLGTGLVNTLFILDEPSVGLHPRDTDRLVRILQRLRAAPNTVVVVEHEASVIRAADQVIDLGPGHGATGGEVIFQGPLEKLLKSTASLTGQYLSGKKQIEIPDRRPVGTGRRSRGAGARRFKSTSVPTLKISNATRHNLRDLDVSIPLTRFVCVTGVSGSGKTTLIREVVLPALQSKLNSPSLNAASESNGDEDRQDGKESESQNDGHAARLTGHEHITQVVLVDQSPIGKTPRSNPAVYIGAFDDIREMFAQTETARQRGLKASSFSFNSVQGQCERCRGAGFEKIEMQFLSDVFIRCPDCDGRRYRSHILEVKIRRGRPPQSRGRREEAHSENHNSRSRTRKHQRLVTSSPTEEEWSIADVLEATVDEVIDWLSTFNDFRPAGRACDSLKLLQDVGLGYLRFGQPINTLSGGESQRLKLVRHLAEAETCFRHPAGRSSQACPHDAGGTLFLFDEPTTGLHFDDVRVLLQVFQRLVDTGHSLVVIEHNLDVIKSADWVIDLGPDAGDEGGKLVAAGTPEDIAACAVSHTGRALKPLLRSRKPTPVRKRSKPAVRAAS